MIVSKTTWNKGLHSPSVQRLLDTMAIWYDKKEKAWSRKCPICKKTIISTTKRSFEICLRSYRECRACNSCGRRKTKRNLIGKVFGKLKVISEAPYRKTDLSPYWKCECECGNITEVRTRSLIGGITKTCGSLFHKWKGYEEISGKYYSHIKSGAENRSISFELSLKEMWKQFIKQNRKCSYTGRELTFNRNNRTASLDRIDSSRGYIVDNIQWIHKDINKMKNDFNEAYFIELCKAVSDYKFKI